jgi:hypothetical protein
MKRYQIPRIAFINNATEPGPIRTCQKAQVEKLGLKCGSDEIPL